MSEFAWRSCWWCGRALLDGEEHACAEHGDLLAVRTPDPARPDLLRGFTDADLAEWAAAFTEMQVDQVQALAHAWAADHDLDPAQQHAYVGTAAGAAREQLADVPQREARSILRERRLRAAATYNRLVGLGRGLPG